MRPPAHMARWLATATAGLWLAAQPLTAAAQAVPCDQGIVRLQDKTGTVQICSALAAQVPALSQQLAAAVKQLESQQQQLVELKRLVSAVNGSSAGLDEARQQRLLRNLSDELARAEKRSAAASQQALTELTQQLESVRDQLALVMSRPTGAAAVQQAIQGRLGDSIAELELRSANRQLDDMGERLKALQGDVSTVKEGVQRIEDQVGRIEKAVTRPLTPKEALAKQGVQWDARSYEQALLNGDHEVLSALLAAGWNPTSDRAAGAGNSLGQFFGRTRANARTVQTLRILRRHVDLTADVVRPDASPAGNAALVAAVACNRGMLEALVAAGVNVRSVSESRRPLFESIEKTLVLQRQLMALVPTADGPCTVHDLDKILSLIRPAEFRRRAANER